MLLQRTFTADDFEQELVGYFAKLPLDTDLGPFGVEVNSPDDPGQLERVNDLARALLDQSETVFGFVYEDYLLACEDKGWMKTCGIPRNLREDRVVRYIKERWISVGTSSGFVNLTLEWQRERGLRLVFKDSHFISNPG